MQYCVSGVQTNGKTNSIFFNFLGHIGNREDRQTLKQWLLDAQDKLLSDGILSSLLITRLKSFKIGKLTQSFDDCYDFHEFIDELW